MVEKSDVTTMISDISGLGLLGPLTIYSLASRCMWTASGQVMSLCVSLNFISAKLDFVNHCGITTLPLHN